MPKQVAKYLSVFFLMGFAVFAAIAWADEDSSKKMDYGEGAGKKLGRGLGNLAFGWLDIPKGIEDAGDEHNFISAITWGPLMGVSNAVGRTLAGAYEVATFPVPYPNNFKPLVEPEFVIKEDRAGER